MTTSNETPAGDEGPPRLNENHRRHLLASCTYIDRLLSDVDNVVTAAESGSPFARYANDLSPALKKLVRDYSLRLRVDMLEILKRHDAAPAGRMISAVHAIRTALGFVDISVEELKPQYMRGYGEVPPALFAGINGMVEGLQSIVRAMDQALVQGETGDVHDRLTRLANAGADIGVLDTLAKIVAEQGLVEFRPALDATLARLEDQRFEVAIFGRVSSGKSSLLNHLIGRSILPVGVTPITAVPTRVMHGVRDEVDVSFADRNAERTALDRLPEFVTEQANPGNEKHVTRLVVRVPAPRLADGIVLVDTPGLGSLATSGAAETLAYLPRCDLGIVLIDAAATLTPDDLLTITLLHQAGVPAMVVLSKADLVSPEDIVRSVAYVSAQMRAQLNMDIPVHAVSSVPGHEHLLDAWLEQQLRPLLLRSRELARESVQRKIGVLRAGVEDALRRRLRVRAGDAGGDPAASVSRVDEAFRAASGAFEDVRREINNLDVVDASAVNVWLHRASKVAATQLLDGGSQEPMSALIAKELLVASDEAGERVARLLGTLVTTVRRALSEAAEALSAPEPTDQEEWASLFRELPRLDLGAAGLDVQVPAVGMLGHRVAEARIYRALQQQAGERIATAIHTHAHLLRDWALRSLTRLRNQFDVQAQVYRVQLSAQPIETSDSEATEGALRQLSAFR